MKHEQVEIKVGIDHDQCVKDVPVNDLMAAMKPELDGFQKWFQERGNQPLTGVERSILYTYMGWKLLYEEG